MNTLDKYGRKIPDIEPSRTDEQLSQSTQPSKPVKPGKIEAINNWFKRHYLAIPLACAGLEFAGGAYLAHRFYEKEVETRTAEVINLNDFLNGKADPDLELKIYDTPTTYKKMREIVFDTFFTCRKSPCSDNAMTSKELSSMMDSFAKMIMVEDVFGLRVNTLPAVDKAGISASYGYGQINPFTALEALKRKETLLAPHLPDLPKKLAAIDAKMKAGHKYDNHELAVELDLMGPSNLIPSLIYFNEANILYADVHVIEDGIAGDPSYNQHKKINPRENQRALSLTVAAYSARMTSPAVAKVQAAINDLIVFDKVTAKSLGLPEKPLTVDGDMGTETEKCIKLAAPLSRQNFRDVIDTINDKSGKLPDVEIISLFANDISDKTQMAAKCTSDPKTGVRTLGAGELLTATEMRYSTTIALYEMLRNKVPQKQAQKLYDLFMAYVKTRDPGFFSLLKDPVAFGNMFPSYFYGDFYGDAAASYKRSLASDMKYKGVVPTVYENAKVQIADAKNPKKMAKKIFTDPKNPMERVVDAHKFFGNKIFDQPFKL